MEVERFQKNHRATYRKYIFENRFINVINHNKSWTLCIYFEIFFMQSSTYRVSVYLRGRVYHSLFVFVHLKCNPIRRIVTFYELPTPPGSYSRDIFLLRRGRSIQKSSPIWCPESYPRSNPSTQKLNVPQNNTEDFRLHYKWPYIVTWSTLNVLNLCVFATQ